LAAPFVMRQTANLTPHPAHVAPLADKDGRRGGVRLTFYNIGLLAQPKSMHSIIDATQPKQRTV